MGGHRVYSLVRPSLSLLALLRCLILSNELNDRLRLRAEEILKSHGIAGTILFCCPYGATARGINRNDEIE